MSREEKRNYMQELVQQWHQSGVSQTEFAQSNGINLFTLQYWIDKIRQQQTDTSAFIQLSDPTGINICLRYPNGVELLLPVHTPVSLIKGLANL